MFPEELPKRLIKMFPFVGETVFDPFLGSGTTSLVARKLGRNSVGYEINDDFRPVIEEKLGANQLSFDHDTTEFIHDRTPAAWSFDSLPYLFVDPHGINKKMDVKKMPFGSRFDAGPAQKQTMYTVKRVVSPEKVQLNNGILLRLIGIKSNPAFLGQAISFLEEKCANRRVYIKYDSEKYDAENTLMGYLFLDNRTFVNNHLVRSGFVDVDTSFHYAQKKKFLASLDAERAKIKDKLFSQ